MRVVWRLSQALQNQASFIDLVFGDQPESEEGKPIIVYLTIVLFNIHTTLENEASTVSQQATRLGPDIASTTETSRQKTD